MRQTLVPGKEIEIPTAAEITKGVSDAIRAGQADERLLRTSENLKLDGTGNGVLDTLYVVPMGFELRLYRWAITYVDGFSPGALFTAANGWTELQADEMRVDWFRHNDGIPAVKTWSSNQGPAITNAQRLSVLVNTGPANSNLEFRIQGILRRTERGNFSD